MCMLQELNGRSREAEQRIERSVAVKEFQQIHVCHSLGCEVRVSVTALAVTTLMPVCPLLLPKALVQ